MRRTLINKHADPAPDSLPLWMYRGTLVAALLLIVGMVVALSDGSDRQAEDNSPYQLVPTPLLE